jgi:eukaryotic-like serine/threonine-protein kinase
MTSGEWERVRSLFTSARELPPEERAAFLAEACHGDEAVRREVESLLTADAGAAGGFLDAPPMRLGSDVVPMTLRTGDRVGGFDVIGVLGRGGMGEVYRACDRTLGREVAIKVLPSEFAADAERLARFARESRLLAAVNHPGIAAIYSVEQAGDLRLLIMELVEGPTLADRLRTAPLPLHDAMTIARELAGALQATHERGIVHRDLKPANIKLTSASSIKLLDFGLAKEHRHDDVGATDVTRADATTPGLIVGTCAYMSPEQARGNAVDKRADIWAFGCVLFEMLTGARVFAGNTPSDTVAEVLTREPRWSDLPTSTPAGIRRLLGRCLEKDPHRRLHDIADARIEIEDAMDGRREVVPGQSRRRGAMTVAALLAVSLGVGFVVALWSRSGTGDEQTQLPTMRFTWTLPDGLGLDSPPIVSPDGRRMVFTARPGGGGPARVFVRAFDDLRPHAIDGTDGAKQPFWSPDGRFVAYFARGRLMKIALDGGAPIDLAPAGDARGGAWSQNGVIVFSPQQIGSGLMRVADTGGAVEPATRLDSQQAENSHRWPVFLPDGVHFLYFVRASRDGRRGVYLAGIDGPASTPGAPLVPSESNAVYASLDGRKRGALFTVFNGRLEARPFDPERLVVTGDPRWVGLTAAGANPNHPIMLSVSANVLAHVAEPIQFGGRLTSAAGNDAGTAMSDERAVQGWPRVSPDGGRIAFTRVDAGPGTPDLWVQDLVRGTRIRVSKSPIAILPVWSPGGDELAYVAQSLRNGVITIAGAGGTGTVRTVPCPGDHCEPSDWTKDGLVTTVVRGREQDVWILAVDGSADARPLLAQRFAERDARVSPDGRLVAYVSEETGRPEIAVQTLATPLRRDVISVGGGDQPVWDPAGTGLFFVDPQGLLRRAPVGGSQTRPVIGAPVLLKVPIGSGHWSTEYDVTPDGKRVYYFDRRPDPPPSDVDVVLGWRALVD